MAAAFTSCKDLAILILGKSKSEKRNVGNSILGVEAFRNASEVTPAWAEVGNYELMVVNGPSLEDIDPQKLEGDLGSCGDLVLAMGLCATGVDVFVLVVEYRVTFTMQDSNIINRLEQVIGPRWLSDHGVVVMTGRSKWHADMASQPREIFLPEWCRKKNASYGGIFEKCGYRCVLFDNECDDEQQQKQVNELVSFAEQIKNRCGRCTNDHFRTAARYRDKIVVDLNFPIFSMEIQRDISLLTNICLKLSDKLTYSEKMKLIGVISDKADDLLRHIDREDRGDRKLDCLKQEVMRLKRKAQESERKLKDSPASVLSDFVGILDSAKVVESIRTDFALWRSLASSLLKGAQKCKEGIIAIGLAVIQGAGDLMKDKKK